jgi:hypothetical protein
MSGMKTVNVTGRGKAAKASINPDLAPTGYAESVPGYQRAIFKALGFEDDEVINVGEDSQNVIYYVTNLALWNKRVAMVAQGRLTKAEGDEWYEQANHLAAEVFKVLAPDIKAARKSSPTAPILKRGLEATERLRAIVHPAPSDEE